MLFAADVDALGSRDFQARHDAHVRLEKVGILALPSIYNRLGEANVERQWRSELLISKAGWNYEWAVSITTRYIMTRDWKAHGLHAHAANAKLDPDLKRIADDERFCFAVLDRAGSNWSVIFGVDYRRDVPAEQRYWILWSLCCNNSDYRLPPVPQVMEKP